MGEEKTIKPLLDLIVYHFEEISTHKNGTRIIQNLLEQFNPYVQIIEKPIIENL